MAYDVKVAIISSAMFAWVANCEIGRDTARREMPLAHVARCVAPTIDWSL